MELDWSTQSPHIRTLFRSWQPGDGYDEATIQAVEERLGVRLPAILRNFYLAWGKREDLTAVVHCLLHPDHLEMREDTLLFAAENQAVWYAGVPYRALREADPPVVGAPTGPAKLNWQPSHAHLSNFLDDLTYLHALSGGAIHGGYTRLYGFHEDMPAGQLAWLEESWSKANVTLLAFGAPLADGDLPTLYIRDGQAFWWGAMAAREAEALDEIGWRFRFPWLKRW